MFHFIRSTVVFMWFVVAFDFIFCHQGPKFREKKSEHHKKQLAKLRKKVSLLCHNFKLQHSGERVMCEFHDDQLMARPHVPCFRSACR